MASPGLNTKTRSMIGQLHSVIFRSEETGYTIARFLDSDNQEFRVVGSFRQLFADVTYELTGEWQEHPKYGLQFHVKGCKTLQGSTSPQVIRFLSSGLVKGVGPHLAKKIVQAFGKDALDVIRNAPERLVSIPGIGLTRAQQISESLKAVSDMEEVLVFLTGHGISPSTAKKIIRKYGKRAIHVVKENPYRLIDDIFGIGFLKADEIARKTGLRTDSPYRIQAAVLHVLKTATQEGHVYLPEEILLKGNGSIQGAVELLGVDESLVKAQINNLVKTTDITIEDDKIYLTSLHVAEKRIAQKLVELKQSARPLTISDVDAVLNEFEEERSISFAPLQRKAIQTAIGEGVMLLTGGPGTGKTTTLRAILHILEQSGLKVALAAPTGRAAKRMTQATGKEAKTIHRLLGYYKHAGNGRGMYLYNSRNPLPDDVLIVDESSMIDTLLADRLLQAVANGTRVIFVGDKDQLPPVGAGNVLADFIHSGVIPTIMLDTIFRQAEQSMIVRNAHRVNRGWMPELPKENRSSADFWFCEANENKEILRWLQWLYTFNLESYHPLEDIQVLTPMRRTDVGLDALNKMLQEMLNPPSPTKPEVRYGDQVYRLGDKCMVQKNNYDKEVFNGDLGIIVDVNPSTRTVTIRMSDDGRLVQFVSDELNQIALSYACTVHKSQGSEWQCVIIVASTSHAIMLQRNLLYTAITRARKQVILVGSKKALAIAVKNDKVKKRYSNLALRLKEETNGKPVATNTKLKEDTPVVLPMSQPEVTYTQMHLL